MHLLDALNKETKKQGKREMFRRIVEALADSLLGIVYTIEFEYPQEIIEDLLRNQKSWDCSQLPTEFRLASGRTIDCSGPIWRYLLWEDISGNPMDDKWPGHKYPRFDWRKNRFASHRQRLFF